MQLKPKPNAMLSLKYKKETYYANHSRLPLTFLFFRRLEHPYGKNDLTGH